MEKNYFYIPEFLRPLFFEHKQDLKGKNYLMLDILKNQGIFSGVLTTELAICHSFRAFHITVYETVDLKDVTLSPLHTTITFGDGMTLHFYYSGESEQFHLDALPKRIDGIEWDRENIQNRVVECQNVSFKIMQDFLKDFYRRRDEHMQKIVSDEQALMGLFSAFQNTQEPAQKSMFLSHYTKKLDEHIQLCKPVYSEAFLGILNQQKTYFAQFSQTLLGGSPSRSSSPTRSSPLGASHLTPVLPVVGNTSSALLPSATVGNVIALSQQLQALEENLQQATTEPSFKAFQGSFDALFKASFSDLDFFISLKTFLREKYLLKILSVRYFGGLLWLREYIDLIPHTQKIFDALQLTDFKQLEFILNAFGPRAHQLTLSYQNKTGMHPLFYFFEKGFLMMFVSWLQKKTSDRHIFFEGKSLSNYLVFYQQQGKSEVPLYLKTIDQIEQKQKKIVSDTVASCFVVGSMTLYPPPSVLPIRSNSSASGSSVPVTSTPQGAAYLENMQRSAMSEEAQQVSQASRLQRDKLMDSWFPQEPAATKAIFREVIGLMIAVYFDDLSKKGKSPFVMIPKDIELSCIAFARLTGKNNFQAVKTQHAHEAKLKNSPVLDLSVDPAKVPHLLCCFVCDVFFTVRGETKQPGAFLKQITK